MCAVGNWFLTVENRIAERDVFEEFRSSLRIQAMLNYLDGYPCELKARYRNKMATYVYCYIISNVPLSEQYPSIQKESTDTWEAFLRRIQKIIHYKSVSAGSFGTLQTLKRCALWNGIRQMGVHNPSP